MKERKVELQHLNNPELSSALQRIEKFSKLTNVLSKTTAIAGSILILISPNPLAAVIAVSTALCIYTLQNGKNHRRETSLKNELKIREAGDFAPILYPEILT